MKDFSLFYGPARTWAVIVGTALVAIGIAIFSQSSSSGQQEIETENSAQRSSSQIQPEVEVEPADEADDAVSDAAAAWARAPQSAADIPFVSLQPSPEPITDAGEELVSSNTSTTVRIPTPTPAPAAPAAEPSTDEPQTTTPPPEPVSNPTPPDDDQSEGGDDQDGPDEEELDPQPPVTEPTPAETSSPTEAPPTSCQAQGGSRLAAIINYRLTCSLPRRDCDRLDGGGWICSSERI